MARMNAMKAARNFTVAAIDVETYNLNGKLLIAQAYHEAWNEARVYGSARELLEDIFSLPVEVLKRTVWFAHNAEYDWRYLLDCFKLWGHLYKFVPCERAAGKFYEIRVYSKTETTATGRPLLLTRFRDSMALFPRSLKEFTKDFAPEFVKQDIGLGKGVVFDPSNPVHVEYAKNDVRGLVAAIQAFDDRVYEVYQAHIKGTTASTGYQALLRVLPEGERYYRQARVAEDFFRLGYYGGLVQLNAPAGRELGKVRTFDRNSSYPAAMRLGVPAGKARFTAHYRPGFPGFYRVKAYVPDNAILPMIPYRNDKGALAWPTGEWFETIVTTLEIDYGRSLGYEFEIGSGYYFPDGLCFPFNEFVDKCEALRAAYRKTPTETVVKLIQNSVYGRFGMKTTGRECCIEFDGVPEGFEPVMDEDSGRLVDNVYFKNVERDSEYMLPHFAAWITANARIALDQDTEAAGRERVRYRDTDSISIEDYAGEVAGRCSLAYGDLKDEGDKLQVAYHAPKCYTYRDAAGVWHAVYKGIPKKCLTEELILALHAGHEVRVVYQSTTSVQTFIRTGKLEIERVRSPTDRNSIYGHRVDDNGWFRPRRLQAPDAIRGRAA